MFASRTTQVGCAFAAYGTGRTTSHRRCITASSFCYTACSAALDHHKSNISQESMSYSEDMMAKTYACIGGLFAAAVRFIKSDVLA
jgi:hypothetical protein